MKRDLLSKVIPVIAYSIPTFVLIYPSFFVSFLTNTLQLSYWESFGLVGMPFLGRIIGSMLYQFFRRDIYRPSMVILGFLILAQEITNVYILFPVRFFVGVIFGVLTTYAVEQAVNTKNNILLGLTTSGWAIGWILAYLSYSLVSSWVAISYSGIIIILLALLSTNMKNSHIKLQEKKIRLTPSILSLVVYMSALTPAFVLEVVPNFLERENSVWILFPSYLFSIFLYVFLPVIISRFNSKLLNSGIVLIVLGTGLFAFLVNPLFFMIFIPFGLAILSLIPKLLVDKGEDPKKVGIALNIASVMGLIIPVLSSFFSYFPELILSFSMVVLLIVFLF
jgi:MFS family permease